MIEFISYTEEDNVVTGVYRIGDLPNSPSLVSSGLTAVTPTCSYDAYFNRAPWEHYIYNSAGNNIEKVTNYKVKDNYSRVAGKKKAIANVSSIRVVISSGKEFDGDEKSQDRMIRAIQIAKITGETTTVWRLADNTDVEVTLEELEEALVLAGKKMSKIWLA